MRAVPLAFTGSGAGLRRHGRRDFVINLVLGGLWTSVARRHAAEYLETHTTVDGTPLARVAVRKSRWPAILLVAAFLAARIANELGHGPPLPVVIACGFALLPYLWATVAARAIDAIRWRELQLSFAPGWPRVYRACWPLLVLGVAWVFAEPHVAQAAAEPGTIDASWRAGFVASLFVVLPLLARQAFEFRRLRFTSTRVGEWPVAWTARFGAYLRLWLLAALAFVLSAVLPVLALRYAIFGSLTFEGMSPLEATAVYGGALLLVLLLSAPARAWYEARVFVLTWDGLRVGDRARVACALDVRAFVVMRALDAVRTLLTCGHHRPEAVVKAWQAKLAALKVEAAEG